MPVAHKYIWMEPNECPSGIDQSGIHRQMFATEFLANIRFPHGGGGPSRSYLKAEHLVPFFLTWNLRQLQNQVIAGPIQWCILPITYGYIA